VPGGAFSLSNVDVPGKSECPEGHFRFQMEYAMPKRVFLGSFSLWNAEMTEQSEFAYANTRFAQIFLKLKAKRHLRKLALKAAGRLEKRKSSRHSLCPDVTPFESEKPHLSQYP
jgi:hypothetical protein